MHVLTHLAAAFSVLLFAQPALAQPLSPFAEPSEIAQARGATTDATIEVRYAATLSEPGRDPQRFDVVFDIASDWVLVRRADQVLLQDFKLNRLFVVNESAHTFVSYNSVAMVAFRVMERQNRAMLAQVLARAGGGSHAESFADDCDAEAELGVAFPNSPAQTEVRRRGGDTELRCNGRVIGSFTVGGDAPPASFWPALAQTLNLHPALFNSLRESGRVPQVLVSAFRNGGGSVARAEYRLSGVSAVVVPYPLAADIRNGNAAAIDEVLSEGVGAAGRDAIAGHAMGGVPTTESWGSYLAERRAHDGAAGVAMLLGVTHTLFPHAIAACNGGERSTLCEAINAARSGLDETAVHAMYAIAAAEQENRLNEVVPSMTAAQASPLAHHPVLGEAYALALLKFDDTLLARARTANLPTDPRGLMAAALRAYPYDAAYWTDVAGWRSANYEWMQAILFYDVANALPHAEAEQDLTVQHANQFFERLHHDFPHFWLAQQD